MLEPDEERFVIKAYSKRELAELYNVSKRTLNHWIDLTCIEDLEETGYKRNAQMFMPIQVKIIAEYIGEPEFFFLKNYRHSNKK